MSDRELLEDAARAYWGSEIDDVCSVRWLEEDQAIGYTHADNQDHNGIDREYCWNPLTDDGDALRIAVKLSISPWRDSFGAYCSWCPSGQNPFAEGMEQNAEEVVDGDFCAATRRAIVRAAAEIGKAMK